MLPEVFDELFERVYPLRQRYDDVDDDALRVHNFTLHFHHGAKRPEEYKLREVPWTVTFKRQLVNASSVPLCASQPCDGEESIMICILFYWATIFLQFLGSLQTNLCSV